VKGTRHSEEQIIAILKQGETGLATADLCRQHGISEQTYYLWKAKYGGMESSRALRTLEGHSSGVACVAVTADGKRAVSASRDKTLRVWELATGNRLRTLAGTRMLSWALR